jgi:hypothetical protein
VDDLRALDAPPLLALLVREQENREGLLDRWRELANAEPTHALQTLELANRDGREQVDIWTDGLRGLRDGAKNPELRDRIITAAEALSAPLFDAPEISSAVADILDAAASAPAVLTGDDPFWRLFDRTLSTVGRDQSNSDEPTEGDWVSLAINRSMGRLATAFFDALFGRELRVRSGIPRDLQPRLETLISPGERQNRLARVIAASRLSYLFAVDPEWVRTWLLPSFEWVDEAEALAVWQGYGWQPRLDESLWRALKPHFLAAFTPDRLRQLGDMGRNSFAELLMVVGVEFGVREFTRQAARGAVRSMPQNMRDRAVAWIAAYLDQDPNGDLEGEAAGDPDVLWARKVKPWLEHAWPAEPELRSPMTAEHFALAAIATETRFPEAVAFLRPNLFPVDAYFILHKLAESAHPDEHPDATLALIDAVVERIHVGEEQREIFERMRAASPAIVETPPFRVWWERLQIRAF